MNNMMGELQLKESEWDINKYCINCKEPLISEHHKDLKFHYYSRFGNSCPKPYVPFDEETSKSLDDDIKEQMQLWQLNN